MKILKLLKFFPLFLLLIGCRTQNTLPFREGMRVGFTPDTTALPTFPAEALYVLGAQWEADSLLQQEQSIADYIEQELISRQLARVQFFRGVKIYPEDEERRTC